MDNRMSGFSATVARIQREERERIIQKLMGLREQYNIESMDLNEIRVAKYEAICTAIELISSAENLGGK